MANNTVVLGNSRAFRNAIWNLFTRVRDPSLYPTLPHGKIVRHVISLSPGTRLGPYEILASLGAGGMGEGDRDRKSTRLNSSHRDLHSFPTRRSSDLTVKSLDTSSPCLPELGWDPPRFLLLSARALWARCTAHETRDWGARWH